MSRGNACWELLRGFGEEIVFITFFLNQEFFNLYALFETINPWLNIVVTKKIIESNSFSYHYQHSIQKNRKCTNMWSKNARKSCQYKSFLMSKHSRAFNHKLRTWLIPEFSFMIFFSCFHKISQLSFHHSSIHKEITRKIKRHFPFSLFFGRKDRSRSKQRLKGKSINDLTHFEIMCF